MNQLRISKDNLVYDLIKKGLHASSTRSKVISNNISNINTKGFKRSYVTFENSLKQSMDNLNLKRTNDKHIKAGTEYGDISVNTDKSSSMRLDGNNVDIDSEMTNEVANTLMYHTLTNQVNSRLAIKRYIINGR